MEQCPICGRLMDFQMEYSCGMPLIHYVCKSCNYDTANQHNYATTTTDGAYIYKSIPTSMLVN